jgi:hypothetical protein
MVDKAIIIVWGIVMILYVFVSGLRAILIHRNIIKADKKRYILEFVGIILICIASFVTYNMIKRM